MSTITVCAACLVASVLALVLKKHNADYSFIITVCTAAVIFLYIIGSIVEGISSVKDIFTASAISDKYLSILLKCTGICILTEFTSDCCKDSGQAALSAVVTYSGRLFVLLTSLPLFTELLDLVQEIGGA